MCGIAGIISNNKNIIKTLKKIGTDLVHRGPDNISFYQDENLGLLHTRLSIIDLSKNGNQPLSDYSNKYIISYNGEVYNFPKLKKDLINLGYKFNTKTDTEVMLNGYIHYGYKFFDQVNGFYALCIYDTEKKELILTRDSYGKKPLFYYFKNNEFYFSSEIMPIINSLETTPLPNFNGMAHFLWKGYNVDTHSAYEDLLSLLPGEIIKVRFSRDQINVIKEGQSEQVKLFIGDKYQLRDTDYVYAELVQSVKHRFISDVPISFLLSGGIDSSLISLIASEVSKEQIDTTYMGFENETKVFEKLSDFVAYKIDSNHSKLKMKEFDIEKSVDKMLSIFGEPFADYSALPSFDLYNEISKKSKVVIGGDGADEIFGGYKDIKIFLLKNQINKFFFHGSSDIILRRIYELVNSQSKIKRYLGFSIGALLLSDSSFSIISYRGGWNYHHRKKFMSDYGYNITNKDYTEKYEQNIFLNSGQNLIEQYFNYYIRRMIYDFNVKVDRTSMANSVEVRSPFQDRHMIKKLNKVSSQNMVNLFKSKIELKKILINKGFGKITETRKQGFTPPLKDWIVNESGKKFINNVFNDRDTYLTKLFDMKKLKNHLKTKKDISNNFSRVWHLMLLYSWEKNNYH